MGALVLGLVFDLILFDIILTLSHLAIRLEFPLNCLALVDFVTDFGIVLRILPGSAVAFHRVLPIY